MAFVMVLSHSRRIFLRFFLDAGNAEFPYVLAEYDNVVMPADAWETIGLTGIGTGPFRIVSADPQRRMVLERNETYWRKDQPYLDRLESSCAAASASAGPGNWNTWPG
jgi:ABC-type transport system substrate-binding protein